VKDSSRNRLIIASLVAAAGFAGIFFLTVGVLVWAVKDRVMQALAPVAMEVSELEKPLLDNLRAAESQIEALQAKREQLPAGQRYRIPAEQHAHEPDPMDAEYLEHRMQELRAYQEATNDSGEARKLAEEFFTAYLETAASSPTASSMGAAVKVGDRALDAGAVDPLFRAYYAQALTFTDQRDKARRIFEDVYKQVEEGDYPSRCKFQTRLWCWRARNKFFWPDLPGVQPHVPVLDAAVAYLADAAGEKNQRFVLWPVHGFFLDLTLEAQGELCEAALQNGNIDPWILHMLHGRYYANQAWRHRGGKIARKVEAETWAKFAGYLQLAKEHLRYAWYLHSDYPEAAAEMVLVAMGGGADCRWTPQEWFYESVRAELDYLVGYQTLKTALLPRWGGAHREMLDFANQYISTERWDTAVPGQALGLVWALQDDLQDMDKFLALPGVVTTLKRYATRLRAAVKKGVETSANCPEDWSYLAVLLSKAGDYPAARQIFDENGDQFEQCHFEWMNEKLSFLQGRVYALSGPASEKVRSIEETLEDQDGSRASPQFFRNLATQLEQARALDPSPETAAFFRDLDAAIAQLTAFYSNEWVDLPFDQELTGWRVRGQEVKVEPDGTLGLASNDAPYGVQAQPIANFSPPFVIEADMTGWEGKSTLVDGAGIVIGPAESETPFYETLTKRLEIGLVDQHWVIYRGGAYGDKGIKRPLKMKPIHHLRVKLWPGRIQMYADDLLVHDDKDFARKPSGKITFGQMLPVHGPCGFLCRNVRIRRLTTGPP
jgi:hypothetical protein